jgi:soluble lytic murein transglycosylase-like protein
MKWIVLAAIALAPLAADARETSVSVFNSASNDEFRLLVPGRVADEAVVAAEQPISDSPADLASQFEAFAPEYAPLPTETIVVPDWMRGGESVFARYAAPSLRAAASSGCGQSVYRPYPGISALAEARRRLYYADMVEAACLAGVPVELFDSLIVQESRYNPRARSHAGAMGLTQLMPGTAQYLGVFNPWDVKQNLRGGARYLREQLDEFGQWHLALGAYNAGPGRIRQYGGLPPFRETLGYVRTIMSGVRSYLAIGRGEGQAPPYRQVALASFDR